jgi:hypothetical protein
MQKVVLVNNNCLDSQVFTKLQFAYSPTAELIFVKAYLSKCSQLFEGRHLLVPLIANDHAFDAEISKKA